MKNNLLYNHYLGILLTNFQLAVQTRSIIAIRTLITVIWAVLYITKHNYKDIYVQIRQYKPFFKHVYTLSRQPNPKYDYELILNHTFSILCVFHRESGDEIIIKGTYKGTDICWIGDARIDDYDLSQLNIPNYTTTPDYQSLEILRAYNFKKPRLVAHDILKYQNLGWLYKINHNTEQLCWITRAGRKAIERAAE